MAQDVADRCSRSLFFARSDCGIVVSVRPAAGSNRNGNEASRTVLRLFNDGLLTMGARFRVDHWRVAFSLICLMASLKPLGVPLDPASFPTLT